MNIEIKVELQELAAAIEKVAVAVKECFILTLHKKNKKSGDKNFFSIKACNGTTQVDASVFSEVDMEPEEAVSFAVGANFLSIIQTMAKICSEEVNAVLELDDSTLCVKCGNARVPIGIQDASEVISIQNLDPRKSPCVAVLFEKEEIQRGIRCGGCAYRSSKDSSNPYDNTVMFIPGKENGESIFKMVSIDSSGRMLAGCRVKTSVRSQENFDKYVEDNKIISLNGDFIMRIARGFTGKQSLWCFFESQVVISDGNNFYTICLKNMNLHIDNFIKMVFSEPEADFKIKANAGDICGAVDIISLNQPSKEKNAAILKADDALQVLSLNRKNSMVVEGAGVDGSTEFCVDCSVLKKGVDNCGSAEFEIAGTSPKSPIFVRGDNGCVIILPIDLDATASEDGEEQ